MAGTRIVLRNMLFHNRRWWATDGESTTGTIGKAGVFPFASECEGVLFEQAEPFGVLDAEIGELRAMIGAELSRFRDFLKSASGRADLLEETRRFLVIQADTNPDLDEVIRSVWRDGGGPDLSAVVPAECAEVPDPDELRAALRKERIVGEPSRPESCVPSMEVCGVRVREPTCFFLASRTVESELRYRLEHEGLPHIHEIGALLAEALGGRPWVEWSW